MERRGVRQNGGGHLLLPVPSLKDEADPALPPSCSGMRWARQARLWSDVVCGVHPGVLVQEKLCVGEPYLIP